MAFLVGALHHVGLCPMKTSIVLPSRRDPTLWARFSLSVNRDTIALNLSGSESSYQGRPRLSLRARIVTSTKLSDRPIGPTAHSQDAKVRGRRSYGIELELSVW